MDESTILLADEDPFTLQYLTGLLQTDGYSVITAKDGVDAVTKAAMSSVKLVITNLNMPLIPGLKILDRIKKSNSRLPVIIMSGLYSEEAKRIALDRGAYSYIEKPINPSAIRKIISNIFQTENLKRNKNPKHKTEE